MGSSSFQPSFSKTFKIHNIAERACAYGIPGVVVDGNDVLKVFNSAKAAIERARGGMGPTLIECMTYRQCGHSRSDPRTYRTREEEDGWKEFDPIPRYRSWLVDQGKSEAAELSRVENEVEQTIQDAIAFAEASPEPTAGDVYLGIFKE